MAAAVHAHDTLLDRYWPPGLNAPKGKLMLNVAYALLGLSVSPDEDGNMQAVAGLHFWSICESSMDAEDLVCDHFLVELAHYALSHYTPPTPRDENEADAEADYVSCYCRLSVVMAFHRHHEGVVEGGSIQAQLEHQAFDRTGDSRCSESVLAILKRKKRAGAAGLTGLSAEQDIRTKAREAEGSSGVAGPLGAYFEDGQASLACDAQGSLSPQPLQDATASSGRAGGASLQEVDELIPSSTDGLPADAGIRTQEVEAEDVGEVAVARRSAEEGQQVGQEDDLEAVGGVTNGEEMSDAEEAEEQEGIPVAALRLLEKEKYWPPGLPAPRERVMANVALAMLKLSVCPEEDGNMQAVAGAHFWAMCERGGMRLRHVLADQFLTELVCYALARYVPPAIEEVLMAGAEAHAVRCKVYWAMLRHQRQAGLVDGGTVQAQLDEQMDGVLLDFSNFSAGCDEDLAACSPGWPTPSGSTCQPTATTRDPIGSSEGSSKDGGAFKLSNVRCSFLQPNAPLGLLQRGASARDGGSNCDGNYSAEADGGLARADSCDDGDEWVRVERPALTSGGGERLHADASAPWFGRLIYAY